MREQAFVSAAAGGRLEALKWLREQGCPWSATVSNAALAAGQRRCFEWLKREGCPTGLPAVCASRAPRSSGPRPGMEWLSCWTPAPPEARQVRRPTERLVAAADPPRKGWPKEEPSKPRLRGGRKAAPKRAVAAPVVKVDDDAASCDCFPAPVESGVETTLSICLLLIVKRALR